MNVTFRPAEEGDLSTIYQSWIGTYRRSHYAGTIPNNLFSEVQTHTITQLLARGAKLLVAVTPTFPDFWIAWCCYEQTSDGQPVLHYLFVSDSYREKEFHIGQQLLTAAGLDFTKPLFYTHRTKSWNENFKGHKYAPEIARRKRA